MNLDKFLKTWGFALYYVARKNSILKNVKGKF